MRSFYYSGAEETHTEEFNSHCSSVKNDNGKLFIWSVLEVKNFHRLILRCCDQYIVSELDH